MHTIKGSTIAVIGGAGFIGSHIVDALLLEHPREIRVFDNFSRGKQANLAGALSSGVVNIVTGSMTDKEALAEALVGVDYVFLLAALWLNECEQDPRAAVKVNIDGTYNVIEACHHAGVKKIIFSSSASVYGEAITVPMTEDHPFNNRTMYGATKIAGEQLLRAHCSRTGLEYVGLRYMNVYGPRMDSKGAYVGVMIHILNDTYNNTAPLIHGDGTQSYDFVYVTDVAAANVRALASDVSDDFFNVGTGESTTINDVAAQILKRSGSTLGLQYKRDHQVLVQHRVGSTKNAQEKLGFTASVPLPEGLTSLVDWYQETQVDSRALV